MQYLGMNTNGEQYMVLYNGNAEVIGNFRALNFYKSSDINIKEDIRLLTEGKYEVSATYAMKYCRAYKSLCDFRGSRVK